MAKYHINSKDVPAICRAKQKCPFGGSDFHFASEKEAEDFINKTNEEKHGLLPNVSTAAPYGFKTTDKDEIEILKKVNKTSVIIATELIELGYLSKNTDVSKLAEEGFVSMYRDNRNREGAIDIDFNVGDDRYSVSMKMNKKSDYLLFKNNEPYIRINSETHNKVFEISKDICNDADVVDKHYGFNYAPGIFAAHKEDSICYEIM